MPVSSPGALDDPIAAAAPIVTGRLALHGGGEFMPGDEAFLDALLAAARAGPSSNGVLHAVVVPTAAARGRPDLAASNGVAALERRASAVGIPISVSVARVVDDASADDERLAAEIAAADLVYLPGGDPDLIPAILPSSAAGRAMREAFGRGATIAGASAGAMALAAWTWTPAGGVAGLGYVPRVAVVPHFDEARRRSWQESAERMGPRGVGYLGLDERTGVISATDPGADWLVAGEGAAHWYPLGASTPVVARDGERLRLD